VQVRVADLVYYAFAHHVQTSTQLSFDLAEIVVDVLLK